MAISEDVKYKLNHMCPVAAEMTLGTALQTAQTSLATGDPARRRRTRSRGCTAEADVVALEAKVLVASVTAAAEAANARVITVTLKDAAGNALTAAADFWLELISAGDASFAFADGGKGAIVFNNTGADKCLFRTDATGVAEVSVGDTAAETVLVGIGSGVGTNPIVGTSISLAFT